MERQPRTLKSFELGVPQFRSPDALYLDNLRSNAAHYPKPCFRSVPEQVTDR